MWHKVGSRAFADDEEAMKYLEQTADELFELANSFRGETGDVAVTIHGASNKIRQAIKIHKGELDVVKAYQETAEESMRAAEQIKMMRALDDYGKRK